MLTSTPKTETHFTARQVAGDIGISIATLYRWMKDDTINFPRPVKYGHRCVRWRKSDYENWKEQRAEAAA